jgi:hypothetical protein
MSPWKTGSVQHVVFPPDPVAHVPNGEYMDDAVCKTFVVSSIEGDRATVP